MKQFLFGIVFLASLSSPAHADVTAEVVPPGTGGTVTRCVEVGGKWEVRFDRSNITDDVELHVYGETTDAIRFIEIDDSGNASNKETYIYVGGYSPGSRVGAVERIEEVSGSGTTFIGELFILNDLGDGGNDGDCIAVDRILSADIGADVTDAVTTAGSIDDFLVAGDFLGDLTIDSGTLFKLDVTGSIGSVGTPVTFDLSSSMEDLEAADIHADITVHTIKRLVTTTGDLTGSVVATTTGQGAAIESITVEGDLTASLTLSGALTIPLVIKGDAIGDIAMTNLSSTGNYEGTITIGDKLIGDLTISYIGGLDKQVIINSNNNVYTNWTDAWVGDVIVHGVTVLPKGDYENTNLGDGAIGLARFTVFKKACLPFDGEDRSTLPANGRVEIWHYGSFALAPNVYTKTHVGIQRRPYAGGAWTNATNSFELDSAHTSGRCMSIKPKSGYAWEYDSEYKFNHSAPEGMEIPFFGYLKCVDVATSPAFLQDDAPDGTYLYSFKIKPLP